MNHDEKYILGMLAVLFCTTVIAIYVIANQKPEPIDFDMVDFNNHSYIIYNGKYFDSGIIHNPDCKAESKVKT